MHKKDLTLDHIFGPKKDKLFCPVFVFRRGLSSVICDFVLYLQSKGLNISWIYSGRIPFQYLKPVFPIQYSTVSLTGRQFIFRKWDGLIWELGGKLRQKRRHLFWDFWSLSFKFFFKKKIMRNIDNQNVAKLAHYITVFYTQRLGTCFGDTRILVWDSFSVRLLKLSLLQFGNQGTLLFRVA